MFDDSRLLPTDALIEIAAFLKADPRAGLIDLGVGVYRDSDGLTPISLPVKAAERLLVVSQTTKSYVGPGGDPEFCSYLASIVLGRRLQDSLDARMTSIQTPGGTGALRLAMELVATSQPGATAWLGTPSWPNHAPMLRAAGLNIRAYPHYDQISRQVDFAALVTAIECAAAGDLVVLHGCCHNPTGSDLDFAQWSELANLCGRRGVVPLIDMAYQGLGDGLDPDALGVRSMLEQVPEALVATSCSKSFGLYRERTGLLMVLSAGSATAARTRSNAQSLARLNWSNPPDHGAAIVKTILQSRELSGAWRAHLELMRHRLLDVRRRLAQFEIPNFDLSFVSSQKGLFALLPLSEENVDALRVDHGVYMARNGRINLAGLNAENLPRFCEALQAVLGSQRPPNVPSAQCGAVAL